MAGSEQRRAPEAQSQDDLVLRFRTVNSNVMGRVVRLGPALDAILNRHDYPDKVAEVLGHALALVAMLGTSLKGDEAILTLQAKSDGAVTMLVADFEGSGALRGYATFQDGALDNGGAHILGNGSLAMTIDPGQGFDRYQGVVPLGGQSVTDAAQTYFSQSEQLPTFVRLAVARHYTAGSDDKAGAWSWRGGGLMIQHLSATGGKDIIPDEAEDDDDIAEEPAPIGEDDENWQRARHLATTVEDHELLDPNLSPERLLYRLFHEEGVVAFPAERLRDDCRCSQERVKNMLSSIGGEQLAELTDDDGQLAVTCEFCSTKYNFDPADFS